VILKTYHLKEILIHHHNDHKEDPHDFLISDLLLEDMLVAEDHLLVMECRLL
jgi:hypothetical protein